MAKKMRTYRGNFALAQLDANSLANQLTEVGNTSEITLELSTTPVNMTDYTGATNDAVVDSYQRIDSGKLSIMLEEATIENMAIALGAKKSLQEPESVTDALIGAYNATTKQWFELNDNTALKANTAYRLVKLLEFNNSVVTWHQYVDESSFVLQDSYATPNTLVKDTDFTLDAEKGMIKLTNTASHGVNLPNFTPPLKASFDTGFFSATLPKILSNGVYDVGHCNIYGCVVKDSSSPQKVINTAYYTVDNDYGQIAITDAAAIKLVSGITFPLKVSGQKAISTVVGAANNVDTEYMLVGKVTDLRNPNAKYLLRVFRINFGINPLSLLDKDYTKLKVDGTILADLSKAIDDPDGQYYSLTKID